jgi:hypothetical protein
LWAYEISGNIIEQVSEDLDLSLTFCYIIILLLVFVFIFAVLSWILGRKRRMEREAARRGYKVCPVCGGKNSVDAILCDYCDESLD